MSGLEPLVALGVASNVMQIISFAGDSISAFRRICESGSPEPCLDDYSKRLSEVSTNLSKRLSQAKGPLTNDDKALIAVARKCTDAAQALRVEIASLSPQQRHRNLGKALLLAVKSSVRKNRLQHLEASLNNARKTMESYLLVQMTDKIDSMSRLHHESFQNLDRDLQYFIRQFANGHRSISKLVMREVESIKLHVSEEAANAQSSVKAHVSGEVEKSQGTITRHIDNTTGQIQDILLSRVDHDALDRLRERVLGSLKYVGMNERMNSISEAYPKTFAWVFGSQESGSEASYVPHWNDFPDWLSSDHSVYWISGKPASGKSTLMKFILTHPDTLPLLKQWRPKVSLLSHSFWKPGGILQKNIKGILCSLVYQIFIKDDNLANKYMMSTDGLQHKDSDVDWSIDELKQLLFDCLDQSDVSFCIFMDGLDEAEQEKGMLSVMHLIEQLQASQQVKICVSSRPEQVFENRFGGSPRLTVQDLTASDIRAYTIGTLHPGLKSWPSELADLATSITYKAEGVFLWAVLVIKSLNEGFENGDSMDLLTKRLASMPRAIIDLYRDMWSRMGEDHGLYQQTASLYLQIILYQKALRCLPPFRYNSFRGMSALQLTIALCDAVRNSVLTKRATLCSINWQKYCSDTVRNLNVACGGFLTIHQKAESRINLRHGSYDPLIPYMDMQVEFIHRTVYDFLVTTEEGRNLQRAYHMSVDDKYTRIFEAYLAETPARSWVLGSCLIQSQDAKWIASMGFLGIFMESLSGKRCELSEKRVTCLLDTLQEYCDQWFLTAEGEVALDHQTIQETFWAYVGKYGFAEYASSRLEETDPRDSCNMSMLLGACRHALLGGQRDRLPQHQGCLRVIQDCLKSGIPPCGILDGSEETSPWLFFLLRLHSSCISARAGAVDDFTKLKPNIFDVIHTFIEAGADLDETTYVVWVQEQRVCCQLVPISTTFKEATARYPLPCLVLEVNAASLIRAILKLEQGHAQNRGRLGHEETPPKQKVVMFSPRTPSHNTTTSEALFYTPGSPQDSELLLSLVPPWASLPYVPFKNGKGAHEVLRASATELNKVVGGLIPTATLVGEMSHAANELT